MIHLVGRYGNVLRQVRQREILMHAGARDSNPEIGSDSNQDLPFVKMSPLWKTIETMEVFQVMPQKPHFRPLNSHKECFREGLVIGCMETVSIVVRKTSEVQFDDPRSAIENILATLFELDAHGFDVERVRDHLTELLVVKDRHEHLQDESKELESQFMERSCEKAITDEEIEEIDMQIKELQE